MRLLKKVISLILVCMLFFTSTVFAFSENFKRGALSERVVKTAEVYEGATVRFIDETLKDKVSIQGVIHEEYDYSYYVFDHYAISAYSVGPRCNDIFLISVAKGATKTLTQKKEVSATVTFGQSLEVGLENVIKLGVTGNQSGTVTGSWEVGLQFTGPSESSSYNSYSYYGAVNYDRYTCYVKRYDVYKVYNGTIYSYDETYYNGMETVSNVNVPKAVEYSVGTVE